MMLLGAKEAMLLAGIDLGQRCRADLTQAHDIAREHTKDERTAAQKVKELSERVSQMLTEDPYARQLRDVADALMKHTTLTGEQFRSIISRSSR